eukprot:1157568-Pelagomonas_calceolata.AAC.13
MLPPPPTSAPAAGYAHPSCQAAPPIAAGRQAGTPQPPLVLDAPYPSSGFHRLCFPPQVGWPDHEHLGRHQPPHMDQCLNQAHIAQRLWVHQRRQRSSVRMEVIVQARAAKGCGLCTLRQPQAPASQAMGAAAAAAAAAAARTAAGE